MIEIFKTASELNLVLEHASTNASDTFKASLAGNLSAALHYQTQSSDKATEVHYGNVSNADDAGALPPTVSVRLEKPASGGYGVSITEGLQGGIFVTGVKQGGPAWASGMVQPHMRIVELNQVDTRNVSTVCSW